MALVYKDRVSQQTTAPTTSSPFDFSAASATTGYQTWAAALANTETAIYAASDASGNWEVGIGTWATTGSTLTRTTILSSSNAGSAETFSGTVTVDLTNDASIQTSMQKASSGIIPGGRLTLTSGTPVTTSDVSSSTSVYYTPYVSDKITLWNGSYWQTIAFTEYTLALGTLTSGKPYDVFAYLSGGALALEVLVWTSDSARATAITIQDGVYCKSGDKTRLWLGAFYTTSTTTTADTESSRYLYNAYNKAKKRGYRRETTSHTYTTGTDRDWNNATASYVNFLDASPSPEAVSVSCFIWLIRTTTGIMGYVGPGLNGTGMETRKTASYFEITATANYRTSTASVGIPVTGRNYISALENGTSGVTYNEVEITAVILC